MVVAKSCLTLVTPQTIACQAPLSVGFPRQEYWSGLPFPSPIHWFYIPKKHGIKPHHFWSNVRPLALRDLPSASLCLIFFHSSQAALSSRRLELPGIPST